MKVYNEPIVDFTIKENFLAQLGLEKRQSNWAAKRRQWHLARSKLLVKKYRRSFMRRLKLRKISLSDLENDDDDDELSDKLADLRKSLRFYELSTCVRQFDEQENDQQPVTSVKNGRKPSMEPQMVKIDQKPMDLASMTNAQLDFCFRCGTIDETVQVPRFFDTERFPDRSTWLFLCQKCQKPYADWFSEPWKFVNYRCLEKGSLFRIYLAF